MRRLLVQGPRACFPRPECDGDLVSYDVITPHAATGVLEAIYWRPGLRWIVDRIDVLRPIRRVWSRAPGADLPRLDLVDVAYVLHARFELDDRAHASTPAAAHADMFRKRAQSGRCFRQPYLGLRDCPATFALLANGDDPLSGYRDAPNVDLGWMLHGRTRPDGVGTLFRAVMRRGAIIVPDHGKKAPKCTK